MFRLLKKLFKKDKNDRMIVQILSKNGDWKTVDGLVKVKKDQVFRMLDPNTGEPRECDKSAAWKASCDGRTNSDGIGEIEADDIYE